MISTEYEVKSENYFKTPEYKPYTPEGCCALTVHGDSMVATHPNSLKVSVHEGDEIIVNPYLIPEVNNLVLASHNDELLFRQYFRDKRGRYLKALNDQYPLIKFNRYTRILGVVIQAHFKLK